MLAEQQLLMFLKCFLALLNSQELGIISSGPVRKMKETVDVLSTELNAGIWL